MLPPRGFVPAGSVSKAERGTGPRETTQSIHPRHLKGLRYEKAVGAALSAWVDARGFDLELGPWFRFVGSGSGVWRWCQPDAIVDPGENRPLLILEIKLTFEPKAWWQLSALYKPVVEKATGRSVEFGTVCASFDPANQSKVPVPLVPYFGAPTKWLDGVLGASARLTEAFQSMKPTETATTYTHKVYFTRLPVLQWKKPSVDDLSLDGW